MLGIFVYVRLHCIANSLKKISKMSTLPPPPGKISADAHGREKIFLWTQLHYIWFDRVLDEGLWWWWVATRDDRIVDFYYPILSCFWKTISVSDPNLFSFKIILSVSENYPKVCYDAHHTFLYSVYFAFSWIWLAEVVTWQVWNACPTYVVDRDICNSPVPHPWTSVVMVSGLASS